mmetsp:Transcript_35859/g.64083  ORF Transcript_35859/g.64083 Transcript_35859/m.64083 type:complete len:345 (+) Transcript_35859:1729-2763(+)
MVHLRLRVVLANGDHCPGHIFFDVQDVSVVRAHIVPGGFSKHAEAGPIVGEEPDHVDVGEDLPKVVPGHPKSSVVLELRLQFLHVLRVAAPLGGLVPIGSTPLRLIAPRVPDANKGRPIAGHFTLQDRVRMALEQAMDCPLLTRTPGAAGAPHVPTHSAAHNAEGVVADPLERVSVAAPVHLFVPLVQVQGVGKAPCQVLKGVAQPPTVNAVPALVQLGVGLFSDDGPQLWLVCWGRVLRPDLPLLVRVDGEPLVHDDPLPAPVLEPEDAIDPPLRILVDEQALEGVRLLRRACSQGTDGADVEAVPDRPLDNVAGLHIILEEGGSRVQLGRFGRFLGLRDGAV